MTRTTIIVAADPSAGERQSSTLTDFGHDVVAVVASTDELVEAAEQHRPDIALVALGLPGGMDIARTGRRVAALGVAVVYVTDGEDAESLAEAKTAEPLGFLVEPFSPLQLDLVISTAAPIDAHRRKLARSWAADLGSASAPKNRSTNGEEDGARQEQQEPRRDAIIELKGRLQLMESVFANVSDALVVLDEGGNLVAINDHALEFASLAGPVGLSEDLSENYGLFLEDGETLCPVDELPAARALRNESVSDFPMVLRNARKPDGTDISVSAKPLQNGDGETKGAVVVFRDVTDLRRAQSDLHRTLVEQNEQGKLFADVMSAISDGIVVADETGQLVLFNRAAERIVGLGPSEMPPEQWADHYGLFYPDQVTKVPLHELPLGRAINGDAVDDMELFVRNPAMPDGVFLSVSARPLIDADGNRKGGVATFRDVTALRQANEAMTRAFAQGRLEVLDTVLHNIGNAINSVSIGVGTITAGLKDDTLRQRLAALAAAMHSHRDDLATYLTTDPQGLRVLPFMAALTSDFDRAHEDLLATLGRVSSSVDHIVDIIRTQRSSTQVGESSTDAVLEQLITDAVNLLRESLGRRGIDVEIDCGSAPERVHVAESRFSQMLVNLLRNAMEAIDERRLVDGDCPEGYVRVVCDTQDGWLVVDVIDNGIGIEADQFEAIFSAGYTTKRLGSGLGLHSTANYVIHSGGRVEPISEGRCQGATMRVSLRLDP